jgi:hypothetical protein
MVHLVMLFPPVVVVNITMVDSRVPPVMVLINIMPAQVTIIDRPDQRVAAVPFHALPMLVMIKVLLLFFPVIPKVIDTE